MSQEFPELRPEFLTPFGSHDAEITELVDTLASMLTAETADASSETDKLKAARILLQNGSLLNALQYSTRAEFILTAFEELGIEESAETADIFASYRRLRLDMLLGSGAQPDNPAVLAIITEQEESPVQLEESNATFYFKLAELHDKSSLAKWFQLQVKSFETATTPASSHNPFPAFPGMQELGSLVAPLLMHAEYWIGEEGATPPEEETAALHTIVSSIQQGFEETSRKALYVERLEYVLRRIAEHPLPDIALTAQALYVQMLIEGVESPQDMTGERVSESRLHKRLMRNLIQLWGDPAFTQTVDDTIDTWSVNGFLDERDREKIQTWKTEVKQQIDRRNNPRKRRRRR